MRPIAAILLAVALAACSDPTAPAAHPMKEGDPMTPTATSARPGIPPIDREVPAKLETATFALG